MFNQNCQFLILNDVSEIIVIDNVIMIFYFLMSMFFVQFRLCYYFYSELNLGITKLSLLRMLLIAYFVLKCVLRNYSYLVAYYNVFIFFFLIYYNVF
jgi:hypothetical protein